MPQAEKRTGFDPLACPKCGYVRVATDPTPLSQCVKCGIVFSKYVPMDRRVRIYSELESQTALSQDRLALPTLLSVGVALALLIVGVSCLYLGLSTWTASESYGRTPSILFLLCGGGALLVAAFVLVLARGAVARAIGWLLALFLGTAGH